MNATWAALIVCTLSTGCAAGHEVATDRHRPASSIDPEAVIDEFVAITKLDEEAHLYSAVIKEPLPGVDREIFSRSALAHMKSHLRQELSGGAAELLEAIRAPLIRRVNELEHRKFDAQEFQAFLKAGEPRTVRVELMKRLDAAAKISEATLRQSLQTGRMLGAIGGKRMDKDQDAEYESRARSRLLGPIQKGVLDRNLYTYQALTDDEIERYVTFLESPVGRRYVEALNGARQAGATAAAGLLIETFQKLKAEEPAAPK